AGAGDACAHSVEHLGEVGDLRLQRRVLYDHLAATHRRGQQDVLRAADRRRLEADGARQRPVLAGVELALVFVDDRAEVAQGSEVTIYGPRTEGAASG